MCTGCTNIPIVITVDRVSRTTIVSLISIRTKMAYDEGVEGNEYTKRRQQVGKQPAKDRSNRAAKRKAYEPESSESERGRSEDDDDELQPAVTCAVQRNNRKTSSNKTHSKSSGTCENMDESIDQLRSNGSRVDKIIVTSEHKEFETNMLDRGVFQEPASIREVIKRYVNNTLFREVKFIGHESQMEFKGWLACKILLDCAVQPEYQLEFWDKHKAFINTTIRTKQNNINMTLKENYMSKYTGR
jgi:hypothetical protein